MGGLGPLPQLPKSKPRERLPRLPAISAAEAAVRARDWADYSADEASPDVRPDPAAPWPFGFGVVRWYLYQNPEPLFWTNLRAEAERYFAEHARRFPGDNVFLLEIALLARRPT